MPWVVYGKHMKENDIISFHKNEFLKVYKEAWTSTPIAIEGDGVKHLVLVHHIDVHPVTDALLHVDFHAVKSDEKVHAEVHLSFIGESPVEKNKLGRVQTLIDSIHVTALPADLPKEIVIDLSKIESEQDVLFIKDLEVSDKVSIDEDGDIAIVTVVWLWSSSSEEEEESAVEEIAEGEENKEEKSE